MYCTNNDCPVEQECSHRLPPENGARFLFNPIPLWHDRCQSFQCRHAKYKTPPYNNRQQCHFCLVKVEVKPRITHANKSVYSAI